MYLCIDFLKFLTIPIGLVFNEDISLIMAMLKDTFPLLNPPINLANINKAKLLENAHKTYESAIPTLKKRIV